MTLNIESISYNDYHGAKWQVNDDDVSAITWSTASNSLELPNGDYISVTASLSYYTCEIRRAFQIWDDAIDCMEFEETNSGNSANVTIAATDIDGIENTYDVWISSWDGNKHIIKGTIQFDSRDLNNVWMLTTAMHWVGNILGLGDLVNSTQYQSVQKDPFPEKFISNELWDYDKYLINQVYPDTEPVSSAPEPEPIKSAPTPDLTSPSDSDFKVEVPTDKKWATSLWKFSGKDDIIKVYIDSEWSYKKKSK